MEIKLRLLRNSFLFICTVLVIFSSTIPVSAQTPSGPSYIIQSGDTLGTIADRFGVSQDDIIRVNGIVNPDSLAVGSSIIIPGYEDVAGVLTTVNLPLGQNLRALTIRYRIPLDTLTKINRITSPSEIFAGASLILPEQNSQSAQVSRGAELTGQSLLELAVVQGLNPWSIQTTNSISSAWELLPGELAFYPNGDDTGIAGLISPMLSNVDISPLPLVQGSTIVFRVSTRIPMMITGKLGDRELHFEQESENQYVALQGIHARADIGLTSFSLTGTTETGQVFQFEDRLIVQSGNFANDPELTVDPKGVDPNILDPEDEQLFSDWTASASPQKLWAGVWQTPIDEPICIKSWYGNRRSYNGSGYIYFHTGVDYGTCTTNLDAHAAAAGTIIFSGPLTVRGGSVIIDHGWGVYTGYWHLSSESVSVGDHVEAGQIIGQIGATGLRVTGPHLHFEVIVNGVQVNPLDWLENQYP